MIVPPVDRRLMPWGTPRALLVAAVLFAGACREPATVTAWQRFPEPTDFGFTEFPGGMVLDPTGHPNVIWDDGYGSAFIEAWDGGNWRLVGGGQIAAPEQVVAMGIQVDRSGRPTALLANSYPPDVYHPYVEQWTEGAWVTIGGGAIPADHEVGIAIAFDRDDQPVVLLAKTLDPCCLLHDYRVVRWDGSSWQSFGNALNPVPGQHPNPAGLVLDDEGFPVVALWENDGTHDNAYVVRWDGTQWQLVGGAINPRAGEDVQVGGPYWRAGQSVVVDRSGNPIVLVQSRPPSAHGYVMRWNGSAWQMLRGPLVSATWTASYATAIVLDQSGAPVLAASIENAAIVSRWNERDWQQLGTAVNSDVEKLCYPAFLGVDLENAPLVLFLENGPNGYTHVSRLRP